MLRLLAILALAVTVFAALTPAAKADPADIEAATRGVARVVIIGRDGEEIFPISHGTGFAVSRNRIVTNAHVVQQAVDDDRLDIGIVPAEGDKAVYARLVAISPRNDLALLEATEPLGLPPLTISGNPPRTGAVTAVGYPLNVDRAQGLSFQDMFRAQPPVTATGFLSGRRPSRDFDTLLHTAPIAAGNSGGPLVDDCGRVIGVNSFGTESQGSDAEFFFAVSTRELLPFLRANDVTPRINAAECRSLAELDAEEQARQNAARADAAERAAAQAEAQDRRTAEVRRDVGYEVMAQRENRFALAFLLLFIAIGAGGVAAYGHRQKDYRLRAIAGGIALIAIVGAMIAWITRPAYSQIETRVEERLRAEMDSEEGGAIPPPATARAGTYQCVLDESRSRVTGGPAEDIAIEWSESGCVNGRTQYGLDQGEWTRIFVPANEAAVSVNSFDPESGRFTMERYLLSREGMTDARSARGQYNAPSCGADEGTARDLGGSQNAIASALPDTPNERLVYACRHLNDETTR
ncbi:S1 family peptidase [Aurantiacibacter aquimixticola]|uniref:Serine protease n=1 Tax=Aurantiacibacter aquimixticola TaxID=1958945 RepID=A0A419RR60_9SPHN|nr:serine protease [Aurantiacibacter aquimixticola]RJY08244.1 serine protease [Aurantiacibacter aquimixticola]